MEAFADVNKYTIQFFIAIGTCGVTLTTLIMLFSRKKKFKITNFSTSSRRESPSDGGKEYVEDNKFSFDIYNILEHKMEIHKLGMHFYFKDKGYFKKQSLWFKIKYRFNSPMKGCNKMSSLGWACKNESIMPLSVYKMEAGLNRDLCKDAFKGYKKALFKIETSFGNKTIKLPKNIVNRIRNLVELPKPKIPS